MNKKAIAYLTDGQLTCADCVGKFTDEQTQQLKEEIEANYTDPMYYRDDWNPTNDPLFNTSCAWCHKGLSPEVTGDDIDDPEYDYEILPEDSGPEGHFCSGNDEYDRLDVENIRAEMDWNEFAWCVVKVTCKWKGFEGVVYLGGVCYLEKYSKKHGKTPREDFESDYYLELKHEALHDLLEQLNSKALKAA